MRKGEGSVMEAIGRDEAVGRDGEGRGRCGEGREGGEEEGLKVECRGLTVL